MSNYDRKDHLYQKAKSEGYRSRAAYKLKELDQKFGLIKPGAKVFDIGAWPGGWIQVAAEKAGKSGVVVGVDLQQIDDLGEESVVLLHGDARDEEILKQALEAAGGKFDLVMSDMSPKLTGIREVDSAAAEGCLELAFYLAEQCLRENGDFVAKTFKSSEAERFVKKIRPSFNKLTREELSSSRKTSNEFYIVGKGYKPSV